MKFLKKNKKLPVYPPVEGEILPIEEVKDPTFSSKMIGDGIAWNPYYGTITAPIDGTVIMMQDSLHAIGIRSRDGIELLLHIGLDTVELKGEGFTAHTNVNQTVSRGDSLLTFDKAFIEQKGYDPVVILVIMESDRITEIEKQQGEVPLVIHYK